MYVSANINGILHCVHNRFALMNSVQNDIKGNDTEEMRLKIILLIRCNFTVLNRSTYKRNHHSA